MWHVDGWHVCGRWRAAEAWRHGASELEVLAHHVHDLQRVAWQNGPLDVRWIGDMRLDGIGIGIQIQISFDVDEVYGNNLP